jgi:hypothetical protein
MVVSDLDGTKLATAPVVVAPAPSITTATLNTAIVGTAYSAPLAATGGTGTLTWSLASGSLPTGWTLSSAGVISGTPTATGSYPLTVKVTDASTGGATSATKALTLTVAGPLGITTTSASLPTGTTNVAYNTSLVATGGLTPLTWSVTTGTSLPGWLGLSSSGGLSGTPTAAGSVSFSVTVKDSSTPPQSATESLSITVNSSLPTGCSSGNESVLQGQYVFSLNGSSSPNPLSVWVGALTFNGSGGITAGEVDTNGSTGYARGTVTSGSSYYAVGPDNRGCASIVTSAGTRTVRFALGSIGANTPGIAAQGSIMEFDSSTSGYFASGKLLQQNLTGVDPTDPLLGNYVWLDQGVDGSGYRTATAGFFTAGSLLFTAGEEDFADWAPPVHYNTGVWGGYYAHSSTPDDGRFTGYREVTGAGSQLTATMIFYQVSSSKALYITNGGYGLVPVLAGELDLQTPVTGGYGNGSLTGNAVYYQRGYNAAWIGVANVTTSGSLTANYFGNDGSFSYFGNPSNPWGASVACTYNVATNGRVTFTPGGACWSQPPVFYLTNTKTGVLLSGNNDIEAGRLEPQAPSGNSMSNAYLGGTYFLGTDSIFPANGAMPSSVGVMTWNSTGTITSGTTWTESIYGLWPSGWTGWPNGNTTANPDGSFVLTLPSYPSYPNTLTYGVMISANYVSVLGKFVMFEPMSLYGPFVPTILIGEQ